MSGNILFYDHDHTCVVGNVVTCYYCKYAVRHAPMCVDDPGFDPYDIVCSYWGSDGLSKNDFCSQGKIGNYLDEDHSLEVP